jgi:hypothetical protein
VTETAGTDADVASRSTAGALVTAVPVTAAVPVEEATSSTKPRSRSAWVSTWLVVTVTD